MGSAVLFPKRSSNIREHSVEVIWYPNGTSSPSTIIGRGLASVARTATGKFTVTLQDKWRHIVNVQHQLTSATITTHYFVNRLHADSYRGNTASTYITVDYYANGALANITAGTTEMVSTLIEVSDDNKLG